MEGTIIIFVFAILLLVMCVLKDLKIDSLETKLMIKETENKSLRRVLFENDLIPERFVK